MADENIIISIQAKGKEEVVKALTDIGIAGDTAAKKVVDGFVRLNSSAADVRNNATLIADAMKRGISDIDGFKDALDRMTSAELKTAAAAVRLQQAEDAAQKKIEQATASLKNEERAHNDNSNAKDKNQKATSELGKSYSTLRTALAGVLAYMSISKLSEASDAFTQMQNRIGTVVDGLNEMRQGTARVIDVMSGAGSQKFAGMFEVGAEAAKTTGAGIIQLASETENLGNRTQRVSDVYEQLYGISQKTQTPTAELVNLYQQLGMSQKVAGTSAQQLMKFTENVAKTLYASSAGGRQATLGLRQLAETMALGTLQGRHLNAMLTDTPQLVQRMADKITGGSLGALRQLAEQGGVTSQKMLTVFGEDNAVIDEAFKRTTGTISGAMTQLNNAFDRIIGESGRASGAIGLLSSAIGGVAEHLNVILPAIAAFAAIWAGIKIYETIAAAVVILGPFAAAFVGIVAVVALVLAKLGLLEPTVKILTQVFNDWLDMVTTGFTAWGGAIDNFVTIVKHDFNDVTGYFVGLWNTWAGAIGNFVKIAQHDFDDVKNGIIGAFNSAYDYIANSWVGNVLAAIGRVASAMKSVLGGSNGAPPPPPDVAQYRDGGGFTVPGAGGVDSRLVQFMATPGEVVSVHTPAQAYGHAALPHFRDGGALFVGSASSSVTGYAAPKSNVLAPSISVGHAANDNTDLAAKIADSLSIYATDPLLFVRSIDALSYMRGDPTATAFLAGNVADLLSKGIGVKQIYDGMDARAIRRGAVWAESDAATQATLDQTQKELNFAANSSGGYSRISGGLDGANGRLAELRQQGAIDWNSAKLNYERHINGGFATPVYGHAVDGFARDGLDFTVPGGGAVDSRYLNLAVSPGEHVSVKTPKQMRDRADASGNVTRVNMTVVTKDANSFKQSETQLLQRLNTKMSRAARRG